MNFDMSLYGWQKHPQKTEGFPSKFSPQMRPKSVLTPVSVFFPLFHAATLLLKLKSYAELIINPQEKHVWCKTLSSVKLHDLGHSYDYV